MSQQMNILRCYSCKTYQVHIVKKAKKWNCKICNFKQSFKQVYFQGSGKDCRLFVQKLNLMKEHEVEQNGSFNIGNVLNDNYANAYPEQTKPKVTESKWAKYLDASELESDGFNASALESDAFKASELESDAFNASELESDAFNASELESDAFNTSSSQNTGFEGNTDSVDVNIDDETTYECTQSSHTNMNSDSSFENDPELGFNYDDEEEYDDDISEEMLENITRNDDNSKSNDFASKKFIDTKRDKNIFDDNEDLDLTIDF